MLKKLIKYGNSTALVLDRAILELLNMKEGALVKLKTDGKSLIITPDLDEPSNTVFTSNTAEVAAHMLQEAFTDAPAVHCSPLSKAIIRKGMSEIESDPCKKEVFEKCAPGTENFDALSDVMTHIKEKYKEEILKFSTPAVLNELKKLSEKYKNNTASDEYLREVHALRSKHAPLLKNMDAEMLQAQQKLKNVS